MMRHSSKLAISVMMTTYGIARTNFPKIPLIKARGKKTTIVVSIVTVTGLATSWACVF